MKPESQPPSSQTSAPHGRVTAIPVPALNAAADWLARRDKGLTPDEHAQFEFWRTSEPFNAAAVARLDPSLVVPDQFAPGSVAGEGVRGPEALSRQRRRRRIALAVALVVIGVGSVLIWQRQRARAAAGPAPVKAVVLMPERQVLADGSVVELKPGATITTDFTSVLRHVTLQQGEAHFQIAPVADRPFLVSAAGVEVRALGTAFAIDLAAPRVEVTVTEGKVSVSPPAANGAPVAAPTTLVQAGEGVTVALASTPPVGPVAMVPAAELDARLAWRSPRLELAGTPLAEAVAVMNQHNTVQLVIEDPALGREQVSGLFRADRVDSFVQALQTGFNIQAERRGEKEIVLRRR